MGTLRVFVSHCQEDQALCEALVAALGAAGVDVWHDARGAGMETPREVMLRELSTRPVFIVLMSPAACASAWVRATCARAATLYGWDTARLSLAVMVRPVAVEGWGELAGMGAAERIQGPAHEPLPPEEAIAKTLDLLALPPGRADAPREDETVESLLARGRGLMARRDYAKALAFFERAAERAPERFEAAKLHGEALFYLRRYADSLAVVERALTLANTSSAWIGKGAALWGMERNEEALVATDQALALDAGNPIMWANKGAMLNPLGRADEALAACAEALRLNPYEVGAWSNQAGVLWQMGRLDEALSAVDHAIRLDAERAASWGNKSAFLDQRGRHEEAAVAAQRAIALDPMEVGGWNNLGYTFISLRRYGLALPAFERALELDPDKATAWHGEGLALNGLERFAEAVPAFKQATILEPAYLWAWLHGGIALLEMRRHGGAVAAFDRALRLDDTSALAWGWKARAQFARGRLLSALWAVWQASLCGTRRLTLARERQHA